MKRIMFLLMASYAVITTYAQADWNLGGNTPGATDYFGTSDNTDIRISTNNGGTTFSPAAQKMIITAAGRVGIGRYSGANPASPLNALLIQNGSTVQDPYDASYLNLFGGILMLDPSEISVYSFSDQPSIGLNDNNVSIYGLAKDAGLINIGGLYNVQGTQSPINIGTVTSITGGTGSGLNTDNKGAFILLQNGENATNYGVELSISATDAENNGISADIEGDGSDNKGFSANINGTAATNNTGLDINISGTNTGYNTGSYVNISGSSEGNAAYNAYVTGTAVYNTGSYFEVSGGTLGNNGLQAHVSGTSSPTNTIMYGTCTGAGNSNNGLDLRVDGNGLSPYGNGALVRTFGAADGNIAGHFTAENGSAITIGVIGEVGVQGSNINYGVYGNYPAAIGNTGTKYAGFFNGDVYSATAFYPSDPKLKEGVREYKGALEQLSKLNIKNYTFKTKELPGMNLPQGEQIGLMANNLKEVFPNLVKQAIYPGSLSGYEDITFDAVNTNALVPVLVQAVKELDAKSVSTDKLKEEVEALKADNARAIKELETAKADNESLKKDMTDVKEMLDRICSNGCGDFKPGSVLGGTTGSESNLFQNVPNPFSNTTVIPYTIGQGVKQAVLVITDLNGTEMKRFTTQQAGAGTFEINLSQFAAGTYIYSLFTDGKLIDTKKMMLTTK